MKFAYLYAKVFKKILRGKAICNSQIDTTTKVNSGCSIINCTIGRYNNIGYDNEISNAEIGSFCSFSDHVYIGGAEHPMDWVSTSPVFENVRNSGPRKKFAIFDLPAGKRTVIGSDVWIAHNVSVKAGVTIGHGAVLGTGAVVTKDVPPYAVVVGCPAKIIKYRFDDVTVSALLESNWWKLTDSQLNEVSQYIQEPLKFAEMVKRLKTNRENVQKIVSGSKL